MHNFMFIHVLRDALTYLDTCGALRVFVREHPDFWKEFCGFTTCQPADNSSCESDLRMYALEA